SRDGRAAAPPTHRLHAVAVELCWCPDACPRSRTRTPGAGALQARDRGADHPSQRRRCAARYLSIRHTERLSEAGIEAPVGGRGNAYVNAPADSGIGLFKTKVTQHTGPCYYGV